MGNKESGKEMSNKSLSSKHIAVLMGGMSKERDVSLSSGKGVSKALKKIGYKVTEIDVGFDVAEKLIRAKPDIAFIALHGTYGEDGCIQGLLELMHIPYTHSGVMASAIALNKPMAKKIFEQEGIPTPEGKIISVDELIKLVKNKKTPMSKPFVVKPTNDGSSVGVIIVRKEDKFEFKKSDWHFGDEALVEEFIPGREISVAVLNGKALGIVEIKPKKGFYDYKAKYTVGKADHLVPAPMNKKAYNMAMEYAERAHRALECRGVTRSDFRYDDTKGEPGKIYLLEVNTHPGMTPLSLTPEIANYAGISYLELVDILVKQARCDNATKNGG